MNEFKIKIKISTLDTRVTSLWDQYGALCPQEYTLYVCVKKIYGEGQGL